MYSCLIPIEQSKTWIFIFQFIQQNIRADFSNIDKILEAPDGQDEGVWKYEHLRLVVIFLFGHSDLLKKKVLFQYCRKTLLMFVWCVSKEVEGVYGV